MGTQLVSRQENECVGVKKTVSELGRYDAVRYATGLQNKYNSHKTQPTVM